MEKVQSFLKILRIELPYNPVTSLLGVYLKTYENVYFLKMYNTLYVYCSMVAKIEATEVPFNRWLDKEKSGT